jgi:hypothetical protein
MQQSCLISWNQIEHSDWIRIVPESASSSFLNDCFGRPTIKHHVKSTDDGSAHVHLIRRLSTCYSSIVRMKLFQLLLFGVLIYAIQGFAGRQTDIARTRTLVAASLHAHAAVNGERRNDLMPLASKDEHTICKLIFLVPADSTVVSKFGARSPIGCPLLHDAVRHIALKTHYFTNGTLDWEVVSLFPSNDALHTNNTRRVELSAKLLQADILLAVGLRSSDELLFAREVFSSRRKSNRLQNKGSKYLCHFALDCAQPIPALVGPYDPIRPSKRSRFLPWTLGSSGRRLHQKMLGLFERWTSDDFCYALVLFLNQFSGRPVDWVKHRIDASWEKGVFRNSREFTP